MKCWLCEHGTNLDDGGLRPGELVEDFFGDTICVYCQNTIEMTGRLLANPELIPLVVAMKQLPQVDGVSVGLKFENTDDG